MPRTRPRNTRACGVRFNEFCRDPSFQSWPTTTPAPTQKTFGNALLAPSVSQDDDDDDEMSDEFWDK